MNQRPVSFPHWEEVLVNATLSPQIKVAYARGILTFLRRCKAGQVAATVEVAKQYLRWREKQSNGPAREVLRWFHRGDIRTVQELLGHASVETTRIYTHVIQRPHLAVRSSLDQ